MIKVSVCVWGGGGGGGVRFGGLKVETTSGRAYAIHTSKPIAGGSTGGTIVE